jgi:hypothetical protein
MAPRAGLALVGRADLAFVLKMAFFQFLFVWVRWTLPRFRYDQLMNLGWKGLLPLSLANLAVTAILVVYGVVGTEAPMELIAFSSLRCSDRLGARRDHRTAIPVTSAVALAFNLGRDRRALHGPRRAVHRPPQVIVYAGAIMVLILFVIMLLNLREEETHAHSPPERSSASWRRSASLIFAVVIGRACFLSAPSTVSREGRRLRDGGVGRPGAVQALLLSVRGDLAPARRRHDRRGAPREAEGVVIDPRLVLVLSAVLFSLGVVGVLTRRGAISILMCIELMLNAGNLAFITFAGSRRARGADLRFLRHGARRGRSGGGPRHRHRAVPPAGHDRRRTRSTSEVVTTRC